MYTLIVAKMWFVLTYSYLLLNFGLVRSDCILLENCPAAVQHTKERRDDEESKTMLRKAHCGFDPTTKPMVRCEQISNLPPNITDPCVHVTNCPGAKRLIEGEKKFDPATVVLLRSSICGDTARGNFVLCSRFGDGEGGAAEGLLPKSDECGLESASDKIFNGEKTEVGEFAWLALIKYKTTNGDFEFGCHGSLISRRYILTAAHCLHKDKLPRQFLDIESVVLGEHDIRSEIDCVYYAGYNSTDCAPPIKEIKIQKTHLFPRYNWTAKNHDIGLIRLETSVNYTEFVRPICLPDLTFRFNATEPYVISGWGQTEKSELVSDVKLKATIFHLPKEACESKLKTSLIEQQVCATSPNRSDACGADSGGPLMAFRLANGELRAPAVGIVSFGPTNCNLGTAVYVNVRNYLSWIFSQLEK